MREIRWRNEASEYLSLEVANTAEGASQTDREGKQLNDSRVGA